MPWSWNDVINIDDTVTLELAQWFSTAFQERRVVHDFYYTGGGGATAFQYGWHSPSRFSNLATATLDNGLDAVDGVTVAIYNGDGWCYQRTADSQWQILDRWTEPTVSGYDEGTDPWFDYPTGGEYIYNLLQMRNSIMLSSGVDWYDPNYDIETDTSAYSPGGFYAIFTDVFESAGFPLGWTFHAPARIVDTSSTEYQNGQTPMDGQFAIADNGWCYERISGEWKNPSLTTQATTVTMYTDDLDNTFDSNWVYLTSTIMTIQRDVLNVMIEVADFGEIEYAGGSKYGQHSSLSTSWALVKSEAETAYTAATPSTTSTVYAYTYGTGDIQQSPNYLTAYMYRAYSNIKEENICTDLTSNVKFYSFAIKLSFSPATTIAFDNNGDAVQEDEWCYVGAVEDDTGTRTYQLGDNTLSMPSWCDDPSGNDSLGSGIFNARGYQVINTFAITDFTGMTTRPV